jgi:asparagine synthase (glutamine-hydrolysing)
MCGIAGFINQTLSDPRRVIDAQLDLLMHRGPDSAGAFLGRGATIGQTRLAIIDLETGDPPITDEHENIGVALNGEIYNFEVIRKGLLERGHTLSTRGDTEVIAHLAEELPPVELARALDGMFAIAIWDNNRKRLVLVRDRFGKKPLYYWAAGGGFVFGSEIKALLAHPSVPKDLHEAAIPAYLTHGYVPTPETFFAGIVSVPPGHVLTVEPGSQPVLEEYWRPRFAGMDQVPLVDSSFEEMTTEVRSLLLRAVEKRLVADVPLGAFLSGGIDSSVVVALMASLRTDKVQTFTIGFEDQEGYDERPFARMVAERWQTDHTEFVVQPNAVDLVERLVWHHDQPFGDSSAIPTFLLSELTRKHVTVALSGDGGDELFGGYERFLAGLSVDRYQRVPTFLRNAARSAADLLPPGAFKGRAGSAQRFFEQADRGLPDAYGSWSSYITETKRRELWPGSLEEANDLYRRVWDETRGADLLDRFLYLNLRMYLLDDLLPKVDRMSMAHGLEVRSPFLDAALADYATRLPRHARIKGISLKRVLKAATQDLLPPEIIKRPKRGFGVPLDRWFRTDLRTYVEESLGSSSARVRMYLKPEPIDDLLAQHRVGERNHGYALWTLLTLEVFLRRSGW